MTRLRFCCGVLALFAACAAPVSGALITNVVETGGDNEPTDTIVAQWTGKTFPVSVANEPIPGAVVGNNYTVGTIGHAAPIFVDRNHSYSTDLSNGNSPIPAYLVGREYIMSGNDNRDNATYKLDVTIGFPATVYMLIDNRLQDGNNADPPTFGAANMQWILDQGWAATNNGLNRTANAGVPDEVAVDEGSNGSIENWYSVYKKNFAAGTFSLFQADNAGRNMYGVVVAPIPEPATAMLLILAALAGIAGIGRRR